MNLTRHAVKLAALAAAGTLVLAACGKSGTTNVSGLTPNGAFGQLPAAAAGPEHAGKVTVGAAPGTSANWILPLINAADNSVFTVLDFDFQLYRPLYWATSGTSPTPVPSMSLASAPTWSNGDRTVSFTLKRNYKWSDGTPVTSADVIYWWDLMKAAIAISPANWAAYTPGLGIPDQVASISAPSASTVTMRLKTAVNPTWFYLDELSAIQPMPSAQWTRLVDSSTGKTLNISNPAQARQIYNYLSAQSQKLSTYATSPLWQVVDGPYRLTSFDSTNGAFTMTPNSAYGGPESKAPPVVSLVPFTSDAAELNAVKAHAVDVGYVPLTDLPEINAIESSGYRGFGYPTFGWTYITYNFKDATGDFDKIIGQLYIRKALAHLENEAGYIHGFLGSAGGEAYGPVPSIPASRYTPADAISNPYPFSLSDATGLLRSRGWTINPGGADTCAKPGSAANECGAGIPAGTRLAWTLNYGTSPASIGQEDTALASEAAKAGIQITLKSSNFDFLVQNYNDPAAPKNDDAWAMEDFGGFTDADYPTTFGVFNSTGSSNLGGYANPIADKLITASVTSDNPSAVTAEASYLTMQQPGLFLPNPDAGGDGSCVIVWAKSLSGTPASFASLTQFDLTPEFWYFTR